jgi:hypothetical protein
LRFDGLEFVGDFIERRRIVLRGGEFQQFAHVAQRRADAFEVVDDPFLRRAFFAERLRAFGVVPDVGLGEFELYLFEAAFALAEVKDTP